jgi:hypothetical protein
VLGQLLTVLLVDHAGGGRPQRLLVQKRRFDILE